MALNYKGLDGALSYDEMIAAMDAYRKGTPVSVDTAKKIQATLVANGYDIGFKDRNGNMRKGVSAIDGRIGDRTLRAFNLYVADNRPYESAPGIVKVAGQSRDVTNRYAAQLYDYYRNNPKAYVALLDHPKEAGKALPYLSDEAKSTLSREVLEQYKDENGNGFNLSALARAGMLGSRGTELMLSWEAANVSDAMNRGARNGVLIVGETLGVGQRGAGLVAHYITGGDASNYKAGGFTYTDRWNPVTGQVELVLVPAELFTTVSDVAGVENPVGRFVLNTVTDPLFLMSMYNPVKTGVSNFKTSVRTGTPVTLPSPTGAPTKAFSKAELRELAEYGFRVVPDKTNGARVIGNRHIGQGPGAAHNVSRVTGTSSYGYTILPPVADAEAALEAIPSARPYVDPPLAQSLYYSIPVFAEGEMPTGGEYSYGYYPSESGGRRMTVADANGNIVDDLPTANTQNPWRSSEQNVKGFPMTYGDYLSY